MRGRCVFADKSLPAVPCEAVVSCCSSPPAVAVRGSRVFCSSLRQWPCEAVVSSLCKSSGGCRARRLYFILLDELFSGRGRARQSAFCSSLRQWPCEAVVFAAQVPAVAVRGGCAFAEQALRQRLGEAVVPSLNKSSGSGRSRPLLGYFGVLLCERHASTPASGRLRLNPESPVYYCMKMATR